MIIGGKHGLEIVKIAGDTLLCPRCESDYLHQLPDPPAVNCNTALHFFCEECGDGLELTFTQCKGNTHVVWRVWNAHPASGWRGAPPSHEVNEFEIEQTG
jgi:hypothetical protein